MTSTPRILLTLTAAFCLAAILSKMLGATSIDNTITSTQAPHERRESIKQSENKLSTTETQTPNVALLKVADKTDPSSWTNTSLNVDALKSGTGVFLPLGRDGADVEFSDYAVDRTGEYTVYAGTVLIDGTRQPLTITMAESSVRISLPTWKGVYEGAGKPSSMTFSRRSQLPDELDEIPEVEHENVIHLNAHDEAHLLCVNC